jgi:hypothetical protein
VLAELENGGNVEINLERMFGFISGGYERFAFSTTLSAACWIILLRKRVDKRAQQNDLSLAS